MANLFHFSVRYAVLIALPLGVGIACFAAIYPWGGDKPVLSETASAASNDLIVTAKTAVVFFPHPSTFEVVEKDFHYTFRFQNRGDSAITIGEIKPSCQCTMVEPSKRTYQPGEKGDVPITIDMRRHPRGAKGFSITVKYQDEQGRNEEARTTFIVNHKPDIVVSPNPVHIQLTPGERRTAQVVVMDYHSRAIPLGEPHVLSSRIKAATVERPTVYLPGWRHTFEVSASGEGLTAGNYRDEVVVKTDAPDQAEIRIEVLLTVVPPIRVAPDPLYLKRSGKDEKFTGQLYVSDAQGSRIELDGIDVGRHPLTWSARDVSGKKVITLAADRAKIRSSGSAPITLRITKPCSQLIPLEVRW